MFTFVLTGIRIESQVKGKERIEEGKGNVLTLVFEGDDERSRRCNTVCGIRCCWSKLWIFSVIMSPRGKIVYYQIARFFRERYPNRKDLAFSVPKSVKDELKNYGLNDAILNDQSIGAWKQKEWVDLQIEQGDKDTVDGNHGVMDLDVECKEIRELVEFVEEEYKNNLVIRKESGMVIGTLNGGDYVMELCQYYKDLKGEYDEMYADKENVFAVKMAYSKKMLTLMAFKTKEWKAKDIQDGMYTVKTGMIVNESDGMKDSLLGK